MNTLFEPSPDRRHTDSMKWQRYRDSDVIPLWVADMDFATPEVIRTAITARLDHPVLGYAHPWPSLNLAVVEGIARDHAWQIDPEWIVWLPGVIPGFNLACRLAGEPGAGILAFPTRYTRPFWQPPPIMSAA
jgi:cystathionine beta-lyase